jgi:hypothetical protein
MLRGITDLIYGSFREPWVLCSKVFCPGFPILYSGKTAFAQPFYRESRTTPRPVCAAAFQPSPLSAGKLHGVSMFSILISPAGSFYRMAHGNNNFSA